MGDPEGSAAEKTSGTKQRKKSKRKSSKEKKAKDQQHSEEDPATNDSATEREADKTPSSASKKKKKRKKRSTKERTEDLGDEAGGGGGEGIDNPAYDGSDGHQEEETTRVSKKRGSSKKHKSRLPKDIQEDDEDIRGKLEARERAVKAKGRKKKKGSSQTSLREEFCTFRDPQMTAIINELQDDCVDDDQVPSGEQSIGPPLPVSTHLNKVFTERQGGGFTKSGKVNPSLLFQSLGAQGSGTDGIPKPSSTPLDLGLDFQKAFRSLGIFCHGFLAGLAFWQLVMVYMMTEAGGGEGTMSFLSFYSPLSQPVHFMFYLLTVVCMISILDRYDFAQLDWRQLQMLLTLRSGGIAILIYSATLLVSLATTKLDDKISLHQHNETLFGEMPAQQMEDEVSTWKSLNLVRCIGVILGWVIVSLRPNTDLLHKHLRRLGGGIYHISGKALANGNM